MRLSDVAAGPDQPAVVTAGDGVAVTYAELERRSCQVARLLASLGVGTRDHVAVLLPNRAEYFEIAWGCQRRGTYWTPVNWHLTADEAGYIVADCGARVLFAAPETAAVAARIARGQPDVRLFVTGAGDHGYPGYEDAIAAFPGDPLPAEVEGSAFLYSSGTTGRPKGIRREHDFPAFGTAPGLHDLLSAAFGFGPGSVYLCPAPLYHAAPIGFSLGAQRTGSTVVLMDRFEPEQCLRAIERFKVTHVQFVPTHFVRMLKLPRQRRDSYDVSSLRSVIHAAAPCPAEVKQQMIDWFGPVIWEYYAGSEGNGMTLIGTTDWLAHPGSVGRPVVSAVHIVGDDGAELPPGEDGIIYFGSQAFEYHHDAAKTAATRDDRGWSTLGDIGHLDDEGYLYLSDRRTDLIISGGVNIYPAEVEAALIVHPAVADVAVIGIPDADMGQSVLAVVQPALPVTSPDQLAAELMAHCRSRLASFKCPRSVEFVGELPRTPAGKLLRRQLRAQRSR